MLLSRLNHQFSKVADPLHSYDTKEVSFIAKQIAGLKLINDHQDELVQLHNVPEFYRNSHINLYKKLFILFKELDEKDEQQHPIFDNHTKTADEFLAKLGWDGDPKSCNDFYSDLIAIRKDSHNTSLKKKVTSQLDEIMKGLISYHKVVEKELIPIRRELQKKQKETVTQV